MLKLIRSLAVTVGNVSRKQCGSFASEKAWQCATYQPLHESEMYNIDMIHELTDAKFGVTEVALSSQEIGVILRTICCD